MNLLNQIKYLEEYDLPLMFSGAAVPSPLILDDVISCIVRRCGLLEPRYTEPDVMRELTTLWFRTNQWNFTHLVNIILAEYSPIENTDRYSEHTVDREDSGTVTYGGSDTRTTTHSGTDSRAVADGGRDTTTTTEGGTDTHTISEDVAVSGSDMHSGTDQRAVTNGGSDTRTTTDGGTDTEETTNTRAAFNSGNYDPYDKTNRTQGYGKTETEQATYGGTTSDNLTHGERIAKTETTDKDVSDALRYGHTQEEAAVYGKTQTDAITYGHQEVEALQRGTTETRSGDGSESYTEHTHGNIGVTTNQEMIAQELRLLEKFNVYDWIAAKFEREMCLQIY